MIKKKIVGSLNKMVKGHPSYFFRIWDYFRFFYWNNQI